MTPIRQLILSALPGIPLISPRQDLAQLILESLQQADIQLMNGDLLILTQKIVSKAEGRMRDLRKVVPSPRAEQLAEETGKDPRLVELILQESSKILRVRWNLIIVEHRLGFVCANAGLDRSNVRGGRQENGSWVLLLPENPDASAAAIKVRLERETGAEVGVLIVDSHGRAWREGAIGVAVGLAGMPGLLDLRGRPDLFGDPLETTSVGLGDEVAAAASILMGQANEGRPIIHLRGLPYGLREGSLGELIRPEEKDLFR
jgi:coenzyme F420-0:L-glutamate ligase/coenzyme F420-1:gamma-L-glutamate ligase